MEKAVLFVDDDEKILASFRRSLSGDFDVRLALGPEKALEALGPETDVAVVVSDLKMPQMSGIEFLEVVRKRHPDIIRVMLTGYADLDAAIAAVNENRVFRFLTKPCDNKTMTDTLAAACRQFQLVKAEKTLLKRTLKGSIEVLNEALSLVNPEAFGRAREICRFTRTIAKGFDLANLWRYETAAMLSQVGCLILPEAALDKLRRGQELNMEERQLYDMHPMICANLLQRIPRLEAIAQMVLYQRKGFDGSGLPIDDLKGEAIPAGGRMLKLASDFEMAYARTGHFGHAFLELEKDAQLYDPFMLYCLEGGLGTEARYEKRQLSVGELKRNMIIDQEVRSLSGVLIVRSHVVVSSAILTKLQSIDQEIGIKAPITVLDPLE